jgi:diadenosine tetraphosphate (Ap4A) HIT family hydrolase
LAGEKFKQDCWICETVQKPDPLAYFETKVSRTKLNPDQLFNGYSFVTLKWHAEELHELDDKDRKQFLDDMSKVSAAIGKTLRPDKLNYELLGNGMPHLHWHIIPRYKSDPFWGRPIWTGYQRKKRLSSEAYMEIIQQIRPGLLGTRERKKKTVR